MIMVDKKAGFSQNAKVPFSITKNGVIYLEGSFGSADTIDYFRYYASTDDEAALIEEGEKDGNEYILFSTDGASMSTESTAVTEYDYVIKIAGSNTCVVLCSGVSEDAAREAFGAMTIAVVKG